MDSGSYLEWNGIGKSNLEWENANLKMRVGQLEAELTATKNKLQEEHQSHRRLNDVYTATVQKNGMLEKQIENYSMHIRALQEYIQQQLTVNPPLNGQVVSVGFVQDHTNESYGIQMQPVQNEMTVQASDMVKVKVHSTEQTDTAIDPTDPPEPDVPARIIKRRPKKAPIPYAGGPPNASGTVYRCDLCENCYGSEAYILSHLKRQHRTTKHRCAECGKCYATRSDLKIHQNTVHTLLVFECPTCQKKFRHKRSLSRHVISLHSGQCFLCTMCGNQYKWKIDLDRHMLTHSQIRPYVCGTCGKGFYRSKFLRKHACTGFVNAISSSPANSSNIELERQQTPPTFAEPLYSYSFQS